MALFKVVPVRDYTEMATLRNQSLVTDPQAFYFDPLGDRPWKLCHWFRAMFENGVQVGIAQLAEYPDENPSVHLQGLWVEPWHRGQGIATELVRYAERFTRYVWNKDELGLWIIDGSDAARELYLKLGYRPTGREGGLPDGRYEREYSRKLGDEVG